MAVLTKLAGHFGASEPVWYILPFVCIHCLIPCPLHKAAVGSQTLTFDTYGMSSFQYTSLNTRMM